MPTFLQWELYFALPALCCLGSGSIVDTEPGFLMSQELIALQGFCVHRLECQDLWIRDRGSCALWMDGQVEQPSSGRLGPFSLSPRLPLIWQHAVCFLDLGLPRKQKIKILTSWWMGRVCDGQQHFSALLSLTSMSQSQHCLFQTFFTLLWAPDYLNFQHSNTWAITYLCMWLIISEHWLCSRHGGRHWEYKD